MCSLLEMNQTQFFVTLSLLQSIQLQQLSQMWTLVVVFFICVQTSGKRFSHLACRYSIIMIRSLLMIPALAFIPPNDIVDAFKRLTDLIRNQYGDATDGVLDYFEDTYIGRFRRNAARATPNFPIQMWNMFHRTHEELPRTNNHIEGWHRKFQSICMCYHPTIWKFINLLKKEQTLNRVDMVQAEAGHPPPAQQHRYVDCNQRIIAIVDDYPNRDNMRYLRGIAHNLGF